jgi:hypothetical protein
METRLLTSNNVKKPGRHGLLGPSGHCGGEETGPHQHMQTAHALIHPSSLRMRSRQVNGRKGPRYGQCLEVRRSDRVHRLIPTRLMYRPSELSLSPYPRLLEPGHWGDSGGQRRAIQLKEKRHNEWMHDDTRCGGPRKKKGRASQQRQRLVK